MNNKELWTKTQGQKLRVLFFFSATEWLFIIFILKRRKWRHTEIKYHAQNVKQAHSLTHLILVKS